MKNDFLIAITQICSERHLPKEVVLDAIEQALILAYRRNFGAAHSIDVELDSNTGDARVYADKEVVEEVDDPRAQISVEEARQIDALAEPGSMVKIEMTPRNFGRIAAQTAKQVILQRIREAERETMYADWSDRAGEIVMGTIRNIDSSGNVILSLGRAEAVLSRSERIPTEQYRTNQRLRVYVYDVERTSRGPRIKASRTHRKLLLRLLENEVPEVYEGIVEVKGIAREPGSRTKLAVAATQAGVDPVGCCVGMRGARIQNVVNELNGERIDIIRWAPDEAEFVGKALSPAKVEHVWLDPNTRTATVVVPDHQLSLAIGKEGQNARLAAKLTNWRIDIKGATEAAEEAERRAAEAAEAAAREAELAARRQAAVALLAEAELSLTQEEQGKPLSQVPSEIIEMPIKALELSKRVQGSLERAGIMIVGEILYRLAQGENDLLAIQGFGPKSLAEVTAKLRAKACLPGDRVAIEEEMPAAEAPPEEVAATVEETAAEEETPTAEPLPAEQAVPEAVQPLAEAVGEAQEPITELITEPTPVEEERGTPLQEEQEESLETKDKKGRRRRDLVLDEETGRVVSRVRRKASRRRDDWMSWEDQL